MKFYNWGLKWKSPDNADLEYVAWVKKEKGRYTRKHYSDEPVREEQANGSIYGLTMAELEKR